MRRLFLILLTVLLVLPAFGCAEKKAKTSPTGKNDVFTDAYFEGLVQMSVLGKTGPVSGDEMQKVTDILQHAVLTPAGDFLPQTENSVILILEYEDGRTKTLFISSTLVGMNELFADVYIVDEENFSTKILEAFGANGLT